MEFARNNTVPDIIDHGLEILFCGINPGLYTAVTGHHFARPGNRFWPALHAGRLTPRLLHPSEQNVLSEYGYGITNLVARATATAAELERDEIIQGGQVLRDKVMRYKPRCLAILGIGTYRQAFRKRDAVIGPQPECIGSTRVWLLPNPSGLNAHYTPKAFGELFADLKHFASSQPG